MSEEVKLISKSAGEVAGAVTEALIKQSSAAEPVRARIEALTARIHYRYYPRTVSQALKAARRIEEAGLPRQAIDAVPDPLLRAILEGGALAEEESMHDRWANLLANALTDAPTPVILAFGRILAELEPREAMLLDKLYDGSFSPLAAEEEEYGEGKEEDPPPWLNWVELSFDHCREIGVTRLDVYNLRRLSLIWALSDVMTANLPSEIGLAMVPGSDPNDHTTPLAVTITELGWSLVGACRPPARVS